METQFEQWWRAVGQYNGDDKKVLAEMAYIAGARNAAEFTLHAIGDAFKNPDNSEASGERVDGS